MESEVPTSEQFRVSDTSENKLPPPCGIIFDYTSIEIQNIPKDSVDVIHRG